MSFDFNYKFWIATKNDLKTLIKRQNKLKRFEPISNPIITYKLFSELYVLYVELVNKLGYVYHHTFQVQKREIVRPLVESALRRLLELKNELKTLELSEYVYVDKALIARKLTPFDLVIWRSPNFLFRRPPDIQNIIYENKIFMDDFHKEKEEKQNSMLLQGVVSLIQAHERARQARVYRSAIKYDKNNLKLGPSKKVAYTYSHTEDQTMSIPVKRTIFSANFIKPDECCEDMRETNDLHSGSSNAMMEIEQARMQRNAAATTIQKAWRSYKNRKIQKKRMIFKQQLYGMRSTRKFLKPDQYQESILDMYKNELFKQKLSEDYLKLMMDERTRLLQQRGPWIMEDISDHIRAWFRDFYDHVGEFHPYPEELKSGTVLVLIDQTMNYDEFQEKLKEKNLSKEEKKKRAEKIKLQKKKEKEKQKKEKMKELKQRKKMKDAGIYDIAYDMSTNKNMEIIEKTIDKYSIDWRNVDEYLNTTHEPIKGWVTETELAIIHKELRAMVDEYMRIEYELLNKALCADLKRKYKASKQRKPKAKKEKKKRKVKDLTEGRSNESLYNELKDAEIIETYKRRPFDDFIAEFNFVSDDFRDENRLTTLEPSKGDIKMLVQECMLGMGEFVIDKPKSLLLVGPFNNGKKLLCNIIASELDAVFMNLSPEKTFKFSDDLNYFVHLVLKVAKNFQPTIIFIDDAHRVFWKKVAKEYESINPRLLQNVLVKKLLKPIKKEDKIMIIGTSTTPWAAKAKLKKAFQKILLVPKSDYGTSFLLWLEYLEQNAGEFNVQDYAVSALAKVLQGYTSGDVTDNISDTLDIRRRMRLKNDPLNPHEFMEHFLEPSEPIFPTDEKILEKFNKWFSKANKLSKQRLKFYRELNKKKDGKKK